MQTKRCYDCGAAPRVERFDLDPSQPDGRASQCKACRRQRQTRGGYATSRNQALVALARRHPDDYRRYRTLACRELPPGTAGPKRRRTITGRAQRLLQLTYPDEYQRLYATRRARNGNPIRPRPRPPSLEEAIALDGGGLTDLDQWAIADLQALLGQ